MKDRRKTRKQLLSALAEFSRRVTRLESREEKDRRTQEALRESEARFWDLYENAPNAYLSIGADGLIRRCNLRAGELLGYQASDLIGTPVIDLYTDTPHGKEKASELFERFVAGEKVTDEELEMRRQDGTPVWVSLTVNSICDADGRVVESRSMIVDITRRKRIESERERLLAILGRRNIQLLTAAEVAHAASSSLDLNVLIQQVVDLAQERFDLYYAGLLLVEEDESEGRAAPFERKKWAMLRAATGEVGQQLIEQGHRLEVGGRSMIGWCVAHSQARVAPDVDLDDVHYANPLLPRTRSEMVLPLTSRGEVIGALTIQSAQEGAFSEEDVAVLQTMANQLANAIANARLFIQAQDEIAGRTRAEEALRESEERLRSTISSMDDLVFVLDRDGVFTDYYQSSNAPDLYAPPEAFLDKPFTDVMPPHVAELIERAFAEVAATGQVQQFDYPIDIGPEERWFSIKLSARRNARGGFAGATAVARDITRRKQVEEALLKYTTELETRNEELDAFAHTVAHDLRNPLSLIIGCGEVLLEEDPPPLSEEQMEKCIRSIVRNGRRMNNIIEELLLLSGLRQMEVEIELLDMTGIVAEAQQRLANMIEERQARIILPEEWPAVIGHGPWVEEVWTNLLSNAVKYGGDPPHVELGAEQIGDAVRFWVRDYGPGLAPEEQARLFKPFTRLYRVQTKGYGLGLSIVQRIVQKLGGQVGVDSTVGEGSTFWFTLQIPAST